MTRIREAVAGGLVMVALTSVALVPVLAQARSAEALMGAAQHAEDVDGDVAAALAAYEKVVSHVSASRALKARALLGIGRLQEKRGMQDARRTYERITREFADQSASVAEATTRLSALAGPSGSTADRQIVARQVWAGRGVDPFGNISPDGRSYAFSDWQSSPTGNIAVRDLATGEVRRLTNFQTVADGFGDGPAWSWDARRIAYVWSGAAGRPAEVRIMASDGTGSRPVFARQDASPYTLRWSPDGRTLAFVATTYGADVTAELVLVAVDTGRVTLSKPYGSRSITPGAFSPDGRRLVYSVAPLPSGEEGAIRALDVVSNEEISLVSGPGRNSHPAWTPDGHALVYLSDRSGALGVWRIDLPNGQPAGQPQLLKGNTGDLTGIQISRDGALWYGVMNAVSDIYVVDYDAASAAVRSAPARLTDRFIGANSGPAWSPDGRHIAFMRGTDRRKRVVVVRALESGDEKELPAPFTDTIHASNWGPTWLPDASALLVTDVNFGTSRFTIHQLGVQSGQVQVAFDGDFRRAWPLVRVSPDGRALYFTRRIPEHSIDRGQLVLVRRDRASGEETELYRAPSLGAVGFFGLAVSPDGSSLAFSQNVGNDERHLFLLPSRGGQARLLYRGKYSMPLPQTGGFTPDGRHVLVTGRDESSRKTGESDLNKLWAVPVDGGPPTPVGLERRGGIGAVSLSPDGRRLVFTGGDRIGELWTIRNLLPATRTNARR